MAASFLSKQQVIFLHLLVLAHFGSIQGGNYYPAKKRWSSTPHECRTVSGPTVGARCVFPFTFSGKTYNGCPVDPEDSSKTWCSVRVDARGKHISKIGAYGHCGKSCPKFVPPETPETPETGFPICPSSHPYARDFGRQCCDSSGDDPDRHRMSKCEDKVVQCPGGTGCEDNRPFCIESLVTDGFPQEEYNGDFDVMILENNRFVYVKGDQCIWWNRPHRRWWMGPCQFIGENRGYAYQSEDLTCPSVRGRLFGNFRRAGTDVPLEGSISYVSFFIDGGNAQGLGATAATNHRIFRGRWRRTCKWVFSNGRFRCTNI